MAALLLLSWGLPSVGWSQNLPADFDYLRLAHPEVAELLELTDQQRTEITQKVSGFSDKLATAPAEQRPQLSAELQTQLQATLTPEQAERLTQLPDMRKLRFNFGSPAWEDVLRWFAKQADLSLVMSTPPKGAFNYTDSREYTPAQAIDLLNSILLTKGFTLVRRDRLLILVEIKEGVPDEIIPRVTLDELDKRGTFEIVNVMFSLGDKPMETVQAEIQPLLGSYGKIAPLPNSKQLLVTETVGKLRAINLLIQSVPSPAAPAPPKPAEATVLESFVLGNLDAKATIDSLKLIAPTAVVSADSSVGKLIAYGPQSQIGVIKSYMEQLSGTAPVAGITPSLQIFRLSGTFTEAQLLEQIAMVAPQTKASVDVVGKRLLVYGVPDQQSQVQKLISEMGIGAAVGANQGVQVFHLRRADPTAISQMVIAVAPQATVTVDAASSALVVRAEPAELTMVGQLIDQIESGSDAVDAGLAIKSYPMAQAPPPEFMTVLQSLTPRAKIQWDANARGLVAIGSAPDLAQVERLIVQLQATQAPVTSGKLVTYPLTSEQKVAFEGLSQVLVNELGTIKILSDPTQPQLTVWATEEQQAFVAGIVQQIKSQPDPTSSFTLKRLPAEVESPANLLALVKPQFPRATVSWNAKQDHLVIWADEADHLRMEPLVSRLIAEMPAAEKPQYQWYDVKANDLNQVVTLVQPIVPTATLSIDTTTGRLLVFGRAEEHQRVAETLTQLQATQSAADQGGMKSHPLLGVDSTTASTLLKTLVPRAQVTVDATAQQLIVIGDEPTQSAVVNVLRQLQEGQQASSATDLEFYPLAPSQSESAIAILAQVIPTAKVSWDAATKRLSVVASKHEQQRVTELLAEIQQVAQPVAKPQLVVYPLASELRARLQSILAASPAEFGQVKIVDDQRPGELAVMASEAEHAMLAQIVQQLAQPIEGVETFTVVAYELGNSDSAQLTVFLQSVFPSIKISADPMSSRLLVWAAPSVHKQIAQSLAELNPQPPPGEDSLMLRSYRLQFGKAAALVPMLQKFVPRMQMVASDDQSQIVAWGRASDHDRIKQAVTQLNLPDEPQTLAVELYSTGAMDAQKAGDLLTKMFPDISLIPQVTSSTITVLARGEQHLLIRQAMERLGQITEQEGPLTVVMYRAERAGATAAITTLTPLVPQAKLVAGASAGQVIGLATANDHQRLRQLIDLLESDVPDLSGRKLRTYQLNPGLAAQVRPVIQQALPNLSMLGTDPGFFAIWARDDEHERLRSIIADAEQQLATEKKTYQAYAVEHITPAQARSALTAQFPRLTLVELADDRNLTILATESDHQQAAELLKELEAVAAKRVQPLLVTYLVPETSLTQLVSAIPVNLSSRATITPDTESKSLIVTAERAVQDQLALVIAELQSNLPKLPRPVSRIYAMGGLVATDWQAIITQVAPTAAVAVDANSGSLVVTALPSVHEILRGTMEEFRNHVSEQKTVRAYRVSRAEPQVAATALTSLLPNAKISVDATSKSLIVVASEKEQAVVQESLEQIDLNAPQRAVAQVYATSSGGAAELSVALKTLVPSGAFVADPTGKSLLVLASSDEQALIKSSIEQWTQDPNRALSPKVYGLIRGDPTAAVTILEKLLPGATLAADQASRSVAATATAEQHQMIEQTIRELDDVTQAPVSKVYPSHGLPASNWQAILLQLAPGANVAADPGTKSLIVTARPQVHAMLDQLMIDFRTLVSTGKSLRTYQLAGGDPTAASTALTALLPNAKVTADILSRTLLVVAEEEDQALAATTLEQLATQTTSLLELRSYIAKDMTAESMALALQKLFKNDPQVSVVAEEDSRAVIAVATPAQHQLITTLVNDAAARLGDAATRRTLEIYSVVGGDGKTLVESLVKLFEQDNVVPQISYDPYGKSLLALALPEQHMVIGKTLAQLVGEPRQFEVFRLQAIEVAVADSAIRTVFRDEPVGQAPSIDSDYDNQALLVQATARQLERIREVLARLGEPMAGVSHGDGAARQSEETLRVIPWSQDFEAIRPTLNELWPQLRKNQLRVLEPERIPETKPSETVPAPSGAMPSMILPKQATQISNSQRSAQPVSRLQEVPPPANETPQVSVAVDEPPVVLIPEADRLIIASSDVEALNQLQQLLQLLSRRQNGDAGTKNFQVFHLKNAGANEVATQLKQLFKELSTTRRLGTGTPVIITSDDRLNMLIVHGSRTDREVVARLLETIDSPDLPNVLLNQPIIVPIKNTDVNRVLTILNSLYRTQLSSGGGRKQVAIPEGIAPEVATVLQQVNAATSGPVLNLGVDTVTNSIIVMAPQQLRDQVRGVIEQLDASVAMEAGDQVAIIKFEGSNPQRIQKALDLLLKEKK